MTSKSTLAALLALALASCAAGPAKPPGLPGTEWLLEDLGGRDVVGWERLSLAFAKDGKVAGMAGCNRFFGTAQIKGGAIRFSQIGSTRMACQDEAVSRQEADYLDALQHADRFSWDDEDLLIHARGWPEPLRFTPAKPQTPSPELAD